MCVCVCACVRVRVCVSVPLSLSLRGCRVVDLWNEFDRTTPPETKALEATGIKSTVDRKPLDRLNSCSKSPDRCNMCTQAAHWHTGTPDHGVVWGKRSRERERSKRPRLQVICWARPFRARRAPPRRATVSRVLSFSTSDQPLVYPHARSHLLRRSIIRPPVSHRVATRWLNLDLP
jgi:hypothetical protein